MNYAGRPFRNKYERIPAVVEDISLDGLRDITQEDIDLAGKELLPKLKRSIEELKRVHAEGRQAVGNTADTVTRALWDKQERLMGKLLDATASLEASVLSADSTIDSLPEAKSAVRQYSQYVQRAEGEFIKLRNAAAPATSSKLQLNYTRRRDFTDPDDSFHVSPQTLRSYMRKTWVHYHPGETGRHCPTVLGPDDAGYVVWLQMPNGDVFVPGGWSVREMLEWDQAQLEKPQDDREPYGGNWQRYWGEDHLFHEAPVAAGKIPCPVKNYHEFEPFGIERAKLLDLDAADYINSQRKRFVDTALQANKNLMTIEDLKTYLA